MLTGYQCEIVAYLGDGEIICRECAAQDYSELTLEKVDLGLTNVSELRPLIRYNVDELNGERAYEDARERLEDYAGIVGATWATVQAWGQYDKETSQDPRSKYNRYHRLLEKLAENAPGETCGACCAELG